ncbi:MAG: glycine cleavage system protein GcvH [Verrucomicrobiota bacterium]|nr:glycine cleavage system protein GcvH [Verrucomicrobiota bacterium]MEC8220352.1 glycine cleavage system protein GcvH [Verrucomicrobiota bacterium]MEC8279231.1 glycine cleavage system protein GcvH [Verrucomicrobiota bacterium]
MSQIPEALLYTKDHEWIQLHDDSTATVGITDYAQENLGDITFVEFPLAGESLKRGDTFGVVESVKAASDLYMPLDAEVLEVNDEVDAEPELLNSDPYQKGWLLKIRLIDPSQVVALLKADAYAGII